MKHRVHILVILAAMLAAACDGSLFYSDNHSVPVEGWPASKHVDFIVDAPDTTQVYNFLVELRNSTDYPYSNAIFFIRTVFPDGSMAQDTLECPLADPSGQWYGKRTGRYVESRYYFRRNARFPLEGRYRFEVSHAMRDTAITGLKDIGLRIEYSKYQTR